jgi:hypothetical protein
MRAQAASAVLGTSLEMTENMTSSLASAAQLARFHAARSSLYRAIGYLIGAPANERTRNIARGILDECPQRSLAKDALEQALNARMELADNDSIAEDDSPGSEAEALSALAAQSARALRQNDITEAARLAELQYRFIDEHAAICLLALASRLKAKSTEYPRCLGEAIEVLINSDRRMLDAG